tara:strand:+ start:4183 stop:4392 length:210 start_codon:yes stop_codon:yes gene_type:complete
MTDEQIAAKELFDKYWMYLRAGLLYDEEAKEDARHCALIAVDESLAYVNSLDDDTIEFLTEVKKEIEKL